MSAIIQKAWEMRETIGNVAIAIGTFFAGKLILGGARAITGAFQNIQTAFTAYAVGSQRVVRATALVERAQNSAAISAASLGRVTQIRSTLMLQRFAGFLGGPMLGALFVAGSAILTVADHFDLFGRRARSAVEELREFGRLSKEQMGLAEQYIGDAETKLSNMLGNRSRFIRNEAFFGLTKAQKRQYAEEAAAQWDAEHGQEVAILQRQIENDKAALEKARRDFQKEEANAYVDEKMAGLDRELQGEQVAYRKRLDLVQREAEDRKKNAKETGETIAQIDADLNKRLYDEHQKWL
jgi:hypothetical protein